MFKLNNEHVTCHYFQSLLSVQKKTQNKVLPLNETSKKLKEIWGMKSRVLQPSTSNATELLTRQ